MDFVAVPEDRVGAVIGKNGENKKALEKRFSVKIEVDENRIGIDGEPLNALKVREIVTAIGRGFSPERALLLDDEENILEAMDLSDLSENARERMRSRIIGAEGKAKSQMESMTGTSISVLGKSVSIIGRPSDVAIAKEAISMLVGGASHGAVYSMISKKRKDESW